MKFVESQRFPLRFQFTWRCPYKTIQSVNTSPQSVDDDGREVRGKVMFSQVFVIMFSGQMVVHLRLDISPLLTHPGP